MSILMTATTLSLGRYFPGYLPPIEALPQVALATKHPWNIMTITVNAVKTKAEVVSNIF